MTDDATKSALLHLSSFVRMYRRVQRISMREMARQADMSPATLARIEAGQKAPSFEALLAVCRHMNASIDDALGIND